MNAEITALISAEFPTLANTRFVINVGNMFSPLRRRLVNAGIKVDSIFRNDLISPGVDGSDEYRIGYCPFVKWPTYINGYAVYLIENKRVLQDAIQPININTAAGPKKLYKYPFMTGLFHVVDDKLVEYNGPFIHGLTSTVAVPDAMIISVVDGIFYQWKWYKCASITIHASANPNAISVTVGDTKLVMSIGDLTSVLI